MADGAEQLAVAAEYRAQLRSEARDTTLVAGLVAMVAWPAWAVYDRIVLPDDASTFLTVRVIGQIAIIVACFALWWRPVGGRWPEQVSVLTVAVPEVAIAWMIPRAGAELEGYLLGLSLAIYATAYLLMWRWQMTVLLVIVTGVAIAGFSLPVDPGLDAADAATITFYLGTASALAIIAQVYRERKRWQQHVTRSELEAERNRNEVLVGELDQLTREDPLTSVGNRRAWEERLTGEFLRARRSGRALSIIVCDFDHFKAVNDLHGHNLGDAVLRTGAGLLAARVRPSDFVARLGGDEFAVLCPDTSLKGAATLASDVGERTRTTAFPGGISMTCSMGVAELDLDDRTTEDLYHRADCALYEAKIARDTMRCAEPGAGAPRKTAPSTAGCNIRWGSCVEKGVGDRPMTLRRPRRGGLEVVSNRPSNELAALYRDEHVAMVRLAHLLTGSNAVAEDLVQDVFVSMHRKLDSADNPRAYLRTAVVNRCRSYLRRSRLEDHHRRVEPRVELPPDVDETWSALAHIPERRRVALVLRFYEDLSVAEIATVMDCRVGTVTSLIHRGLASMREVLS